MDPSLPDLSPIALFLHADRVVQGVVLLLVATSVGVWAIAFDRAIRVARLHSGARALDALARAGGPPPEDAPPGLPAAVLGNARAAAADRVPGEGPGERRERLREAMRLALADALAPAQAGLSFLATVGSAAPFVGLFGTVWGIMRAFTAIARTGDTSLTAVAPGIAEALAATAVGLAAAIPAVLAYNRLASGLGSARQTCLGAITRLSARMVAAADMPGVGHQGAAPFRSAAAE
jgi:biopolymer transport protein TolQ